MAKKNEKEPKVEPADSGETLGVSFTDIKEHFEIIGSKNRRFLLASGQIVDLRFGIPKNALELYKSGFKYLGLKKTASVLFQDDTSEFIAKLIQQAPRKEDVLVLKKVFK